LEFILQIWGGSCYLGNKVCFALSAGRENQVGYRIHAIGWFLYILGVPPWVIILAGNQNWIAASIEAGGLPAMILGLYVSWFRGRTPKKRIYSLVTFLTYAALVVGVANSLYVHSGLTSFSQFLEIGVMFGFLLSGYYMAKGNPSGWLYFMLGNSSMALLMLIENVPILMVQQLISLVFVVYGYRKTVREN